MSNVFKPKGTGNIQDNHDITRQVKQPEIPPPPPKPPKPQKQD